MNRFQKGFIIAVVVVLILVFLMIYRLSAAGWGYAGYYGYRTGPSFWYFGGPSYYTSRSVRSGSVGGPSHLGGGPGRGK